MSLYGRQFTDVVMDDGSDFELQGIKALNGSSLPPRRLSQAKRQALAANRVVDRARQLDGVPIRYNGYHNKSPGSYYLGATPGFGAEDGLNHGDIPFRARPVYLRLVRTRTQARDYAAGGFHVSVTRGTAGGCQDPAENFDTDVAAALGCNKPINSAEIRVLWATAGEAYKAAFFRGANGNVSVDAIKDDLRAANRLADAAYAAEGVTPPRDPQTQESEPALDPKGQPDKRSPWLVAGLLAAALGAAVTGNEWRATGEFPPVTSAGPLITGVGLVIAIGSWLGREKKA